MYRAKKIYGLKCNRFRTVLGYITSSNSPTLVDVKKNEALKIPRGHKPTSLSWFLLYYFPHTNGYCVINCVKF